LQRDLAQLKKFHHEVAAAAAKEASRYGASFFAGISLIISHGLHHFIFAIRHDGVLGSQVRQCYECESSDRRTAAVDRKTPMTAG
jgi:hypothetical protein